MKRIKRKKDPRRFQIRDFRCPVCGTRVPAIKWKGRTERGHVKTMWCHVCRRETDHVQISER